MDQAPTQPLPAVPKRQANATILAFQYQLWHTVLAWLQLQPGERLWIEQAEDYDVIADGSATAVQISHSAGNVSLRDGKVREAIFHCWELQQKQADRAVQFRYITRGEPTVEAGDPFGAGKCGLEVWALAAADLNAAAKVLAFLREEKDHYAQPFRTFLEACSPLEATKWLFRPLVFELGSGDVEVVQDAIKAQLSAVADEFDIDQAAALQALNHLHARVAKTASQAGERWLTHDLLRDVLAEGTVVVVRTFFEKFMRSFEKQDPANLALAAIRAQGEPFIESPLPPRPECIMRPKVVEDLVAMVRERSFTFIQASTGMGKTTVAALLASAQAGTWKWVAMGGLRGEAVVQRLQALSGWIAREQAPPHLILDDVDVSDVASAGLSHAFSVFAISLATRKGKLLATMQSQPTARVMEACRASSESIYHLPGLGEDECRELAISMDCPEGSQRELWSYLALARSRGHPQLARAFLLDGKQRNWQQRSLGPIGDESVDQVRFEARRMASALPENTKELLFRLSTISGRFRRTHALALGSSPPALSRPGEAFDPLVGAWIERVDQGSYRVSPLLSTAALEIFGEERVRELRVQVAEAFIEVGKMYPHEGAQAFEHAWKARHQSLLVGFVRSLSAEGREIFKLVSPHLTWFVFEAIDEGETLFADNPHLSLLLRYLQGRIAARTAAELAPLVFRAWRAELEKGGLAARPGQRYMLAEQALLAFNVRFTAREVLAFVGVLVESLRDDPELGKIADKATTEIPSQIRGEFSFDGTVGLHAAMSLQRCRGVDPLADWMDAMAAAEPWVRERILQAARLNPWWAGMMIDGAWLDEEERPQPNWDRCLSVLERARRFGMDRNVPAFVESSIRAMAIVRDEHQHDPSAALSHLDRDLAGLVKPSSKLLDARAAVLSHLGRHAEAVAMWDLAHADWHAASRHDRSDVFSARLRAIALAKLGDQRGAAKGFADAFSRLPKERSAAQGVGLQAEAGLCWWAAGEFTVAFTALRDAVETADCLPVGQADLLAFRMRRMVGYAVQTIHGRLTGTLPAGHKDLPPGAVSDVITPEALKKQPEISFDHIWLMLERLANLLGLETNSPPPVQERIARSQNPVMRFLRLETRIGRALWQGEYAELPNFAIELEAEFAKGQQLMNQRGRGSVAPEASPSDRWNSGSEASGEPFFSAALISACVHGKASEALESWKRSAALRGWGREFAEWLARMEALLSRPIGQLVKLLIDPRRRPLYDVLIASAHVAASDEASPPELLLSQALLLGGLDRRAWGGVLGYPLAILYERTWRQVGLQPALLRNPRISIPTILEACEAKNFGIAKAAGIVLAASEATGPTIENALRVALIRLRDQALPTSMV